MARSSSPGPTVVNNSATTNETFHPQTYASNYEEFLEQLPSSTAAPPELDRPPKLDTEWKGLVYRDVKKNLQLQTTTSSTALPFLQEPLRPLFKIEAFQQTNVPPLPLQANGEITYPPLDPEKKPSVTADPFLTTLTQGRSFRGFNNAGFAKAYIPQLSQDARFSWRAGIPTPIWQNAKIQSRNLDSTSNLKLLKHVHIKQSPRRPSRIQLLRAKMRREEKLKNIANLSEENPVPRLKTPPLQTTTIQPTPDVQRATTPGRLVQAGSENEYDEYGDDDDGDVFDREFLDPEDRENDDYFGDERDEFGDPIRDDYDGEGGDRDYFANDPDFRDMDREGDDDYQVIKTHIL